MAVYNATGLDNRAGDVVATLVKDGFSPASSLHSETDRPTASSLVYGPGEAARAKAVADALGLPATAVVQGTAAGLKLVIGADWTSGSTFPGGKPAPAPLDTKAALAGTLAQNGTDKGCVAVSTAETENKLGLSTGAAWNSPPENPQQMFDLYPKVPLSAP